MTGHPTAPDPAGPATSGGATAASGAPDATGTGGAADPAAVTALAAILRTVHAAVYAAAAAGGALAPLGPAAAGVRDLARMSYLAHEQLRDDLTAAIRARGGEPPPALPAYELPVAPRAVGPALDLLARIEDATAAAAHDALAVLVGPTRPLAVDALVGTAVRAQRARLAAGLPPAAATRALPGT